MFSGGTAKQHRVVMGSFLQVLTSMTSFEIITSITQNTEKQPFENVLQNSSF